MASTNQSAATDVVVELPTGRREPRGRPQGRPETRDGPPGLFRALGFFGMDEIEVSILAGLLTGDPVLLVGPHGAAKTALVRRLAAEMGLRFWAYDASKALFEDVIGFPNPRSLGQGVVDYVGTPLTVWDKEFLLLDEISRASAAMQNKWLELVRSRRVMGREVSGLRHVFAAMNPSGYLGANPLDEALAGRFAFVVQVPDAMSMDDDDLVSIVETTTPDDAPLCPALHASPRHGRPRAARDLPDVASLLARARARLPAVVRRHGAFATRYVFAVAGELSGRKLQPDGRRLGMVRRNLLAVLALESLAGEPDHGHLEGLFYRTLDHSLPYRATVEAPPADTLYPCHALAWRAANEGIDASGVFSRVAGRGRLDGTLRFYEERLAELSEEDHHQTLNTILERIDAATDAELGLAVAALLAFARIVARHTDHVPGDVTVRALERIQQVAAYGAVGWRAYSDVLDEGVRNTRPHLGSARQSFALRVAVECGRKDDPCPTGPVDADAARARYVRVLAALGARGPLERVPRGPEGDRAATRRRP
jgi:hypothetical protein